MWGLMTLTRTNVAQHGHLNKWELLASSLWTVWMESGSLDGEVPQGSWRDRPWREEVFVEEVVTDLRFFQLKLTLLHCVCRSISRAWKVRFSSWRSLWLLCTPVGLAASWGTAADCETKKRREALALGPLVSGNFGKFGHLSFTCSLPSSQVWMLLLCYKLIFLPHILQDLNQIFSRGCIQLHVDLEVIWDMMFPISSLITERENELAVTIRRPEVCWWAAVHRSIRKRISLCGCHSFTGLIWILIVCWWQSNSFFPLIILYSKQ